MTAVRNALWAETTASKSDAAERLDISSSQEHSITYGEASGGGGREEKRDYTGFGLSEWGGGGMQGPCARI
jgi:hypothetical protein